MITDPADEGVHPPGAELHWNESWYFDAVSDDGTLGLYLRLGRLPNQQRALYTVAVTGPGRPSVMFSERVPLPAAGDPAQVVDSDRLRAEHHCEVPLRRFRVICRARAQSHADPAAPLREETGDPIGVELDVSWETDGMPYRWTSATRYEIPCRVAGRLRVGDESFHIRGPGQRDHSWGVRDWWSVDWMWSAIHLDDGTRLHAVGVRQIAPIGVGYTQRDGKLEEFSEVVSTEKLAANGLIEECTISLQPGNLVLHVTPRAFGAVHLRAPDGRVSHFPRAMCDVKTSDGRCGVGWVEWNRVQG